MAKRFGRNQKRRMREQINKLSHDNTHYRIRSGTLEDRLINWSRSMHRHLGREHPLNEDINRIMLKRLPYVEERYRFMAPQKLDVHDTIGYSLDNIDITTTYIDTVLHLVNIKPDKVRPVVIAELVAPDKQCYYAIDSSALKEGRRDPRFIKWISEELAHKLAEHIAT